MPNVLSKGPNPRPDNMDETVLSSILVGIGYLAAMLWTKLAMSRTGHGSN